MNAPPPRLVVDVCYTKYINVSYRCNFYKFLFNFSTERNDTDDEARWYFFDLHNVENEKQQQQHRENRRTQMKSTLFCFLFSFNKP